jgi:exopolyphosphatase/guanosine-5'-triphosphate,3'-diphosphate pyrophosphatase
VRLKEIFIEDDPPTPRQLHRMHQFIEGKLSEAVRKLGRTGWERAIATSATASAVASTVARLPGGAREDVDRLRVSTAQVRKLYQKLSTRDVAARRKVTGIGPRRAEIIVPGIAVLQDFLGAFGLRGFYYSRAGVRDGIIADLAARNVGAERARLSREQRREVEQLARRFGVPLERARAVAHMSHLLFLALQPLHGLPAQYGKLLEAASYLADVGHYVSSSSHHKHSYYVIANSDLAGFTERERLSIATLCRYHRKALPSAMHAAFQSLTADERRPLALMIPLVRLADNLVGDEPHQRIDGIQCKLQNGQVTLEIRATGDLDLAEWGAEQAGEAFRQIYNRPMEVVRAKG